MNRFTKSLYWLGMIWSLLCFFFITAVQFLPIEFSNINGEEGFYGLMLCTFPVAVLLTLVRNYTNKVYKIITVLIAVISVPILGLFSFGVGMCGYSNDGILFINKSDSSLKIVQRHYGCGAYDSDMPKHEFFEMKNLTRQLRYAKKIDTLFIDPNKWVRIVAHE